MSNSDDIEQIRKERDEARAECEALRAALAVPDVWPQEERDGMSEAFKHADARHGHFETLFAVAAWLLRHRSSRAAAPQPAGASLGALSPFASDVLRERAEQVTREGWTPEHDDEHADGSMAAAAAAYALSGYLAGEWRAYAIDPLGLWPWDVTAWKPKDARSDLKRAAALLIAEGERIDRAASKGDAQ